ncbi:MAG: hypothetical protein PWQ88_200 [Candidatus Methanomethylophilaceae archaeon]|jgi:Histidinol phosphatase and related hydrolases of the PHP family|nr:hypothetical protein [Candidatus Methanomethylophilaceae archaeon]MDI3542116.1 hypothetical protein [Candidatus Methanomethylophilaceae archaeon]HIJ00636.1 histidinol phosphate phosphatase domain-containing protein [Candidatus Methanomethylophilaceae archaeon]
MRYDLHTHSLISDGELLPAELAARAMAIGHEALAITDHVDMTNIEEAVTMAVRAAELSEDYVRLIPGVEITHVPPRQIDGLVKRARKLGAEIIVIHGETVTEPVAPGTNAVAVRNPEVDILAHPGLIIEEDVEEAARNDVTLEISGRRGHSLSNGHVARLASSYGARMVVNSDAHAPEDLMDERRAMTVALGAGLSEKLASCAVNDAPAEILRRL